MVIKEVGIMVRGYPLVYSNYHDIGENKIEIILRSGLLSGILSFVESAFSNQSIEYIESKNFIIAFKADKIKAFKSIEEEPIISYAILDKEKKIDNFISKNVIPILKKILKKFISLYNNRNLTNISQFDDFKEQLNNVFEIESKSIEDKFKGLIS